MKKVLIISTHFAPDIHVGAKRVTKFAKYLPLYGWQPVILTKEVQYYHGIDETLNDDLPQGLAIHRVREWHPFGAKGPGWKASVKDTGAGGLDKPANQRWLSYIKDLFDSACFYDYSWLLPAFFTGLRLLRQQEISLILSTSPNPDAHIVGLLLKTLTGVKWVCEFRDPWMGIATSYQPRSVVEREVSELLERLTLRKSDHIVTVGEIMKQYFARLVGDDCNDKIGVIYNGYDKEDLVGLGDASKQDERFVIAYLGTWGHIRDPEFFLRALGSLLRKRRYLRERMRVNFIGEVKFDVDLAIRIEQLISEENLGMVVHRVPFVPRKQGLSYLYASDVLLLVIGMPIGRPDVPDWMVTSKLFEYLSIRKPILALVPPDGEAARIIRETNAGEIIAPTDVDRIEEKIYDMYKRFESGDLTSNPVGIEKFDRRIQTGMLAEVFDSLVAVRAGPKADVCSA